MTNKQLKAACKYLGFRLYVIEGEYEVAVPGCPNASYFTNDRRDALGTAVEMYMHFEGIPQSDRLAKGGYFFGKALEAAGVK